MHSHQGPKPELPGFPSRRCYNYLAPQLFVKWGVLGPTLVDSHRLNEQIHIKSLVHGLAHSKHSVIINYCSSESHDLEIWASDQRTSATETETDFTKPTRVIQSSHPDKGCVSRPVWVTARPSSLFMEEAVSAFLADIREAARIPLCSQGLRSPHRELRAEVTAPGALLLLILGSRGHNSPLARTKKSACLCFSFFLRQGLT